MSLLIVRAKVMLQSEEDTESQGKYDLGNIAQSNKWVWRQVALPFEEIWSITEYNDKKSVVQLKDEEKYLVFEKFEDVYKKWDDLRLTYGEFLKDIRSDLEDEINKEGEKNSEEEDD